MINSLRKKFILITMLSLICVLTALVGAINAVNYADTSAAINARMDILAANGGYFPPTKLNDRLGGGRDGLSPEAPFNTRYFSVTLGDNNQIIQTNTGKIAAVDAATAADFAVQLSEKGKTEGYLADYRYKAIQAENGTMYIFLDCERELSLFRMFLTSSVAISVACVVLVFVLVFFLSRIAIRPMAQSYQKQKMFITDASHEIKTPLTIIDANTAMLEIDSGENDWTRSIHNQVSRLSKLTEKLILLSRMEEENSNLLTAASFSLSNAVSTLADSFAPVASAQGKNFTVDIQPDISYTGDENYISQAVSALLDNAMKYTNDGGEIRLSVKLCGKSRVIELENSVDSIEQGNLDVLFDRFYCRDTSRNSKKSGSGIGLSVAKTIVQAHKGKIHARSKDGKSVTFTITL